MIKRKIIKIVKINEILIGRFEKLNIPLRAWSIMLVTVIPVVPCNLFCLSNFTIPDLNPAQEISPLKNISFSSTFFSSFKIFLSINLKSETC